MGLIYFTINWKDRSLRFFLLMLDWVLSESIKCLSNAGLLWDSTMLRTDWLLTLQKQSASWVSSFCFSAQLIMHHICSSKLWALAFNRQLTPFSFWLRDFFSVVVLEEENFSLNFGRRIATKPRHFVDVIVRSATVWRHSAWRATATQTVPRAMSTCRYGQDGDALSTCTCEGRWWGRGETVSKPRTVSFLLRHAHLRM